MKIFIINFRDTNDFQYYKLNLLKEYNKITESAFKQLFEILENKNGV